MAMAEPAFTTPSAWIVLSEQQHNKAVDNASILNASLFACTSSFRMFTTRDTAWNYCREVFVATAGPDDFEKNSPWVILEVQFTDNEWCHKFLTKDPDEAKIRTGSTPGVLHVHGNLDLNGASVVHTPAIMTPVSFEEWAETHLSKQAKAEAAKCGHCDLTAVAWRGSVGNHLRHKAANDDEVPKAYCAECWYTYFHAKKTTQ